MRRLGKDDGSAVMMALALLVLLGVAALVVDVGNLYWERRQLQNGADAASLAVAMDCAHRIADGDSNCDPGLAEDFGVGARTVAQGYADANAADGASSLVEPPSGVTLDILGPNGGEVTVNTLVDDGGASQVQHWFARTMGFEGTRVTATASAVYGAIVGLPGGFPIAVCEGMYDAHQDVAPPDAPVQIPIKLGPPGNPAEIPDMGCPISFDDTGPGNFNWLHTDGSGCAADLTVNGEITGPSDPGANPPPGECSEDMDEIKGAIEAFAPGMPDPEDNEAARTRYIAVFSSLDGGGSATYHISGLAAFVFTGVNLGPQDRAIIEDGTWSPDGWQEYGDLPNNQQCWSNPSRCVQGYFKGDLLTAGEWGAEIDPEVESALLGVRMSR